MKLEIWIPAHNEEKVILETLVSLQSAIGNCTDMSLGVACNGCTDLTEALVQKFGAKKLFLPAIGKWRTIEAIVQHSQAEWIGFVDAGTMWNPGLWHGDKTNSSKTLASRVGVSRDRLASQLPDWFQQSNLMGFTLPYTSGKMNHLEKAYWKFESTFKKTEEMLGGLVTVSGFSMFFKRAELQKAIEFLHQQFGPVNWLNDDVILPLTLRFLFPEKQIRLYVSPTPSALEILDLGHAADPREKGRRLRMMRGNLQWIRRMFPLFFSARYFSPSRLVIFFLILRKALKVFWAYLFLIFFVLAAVLVSPWTLLLPVAILLVPKFGISFGFAMLASLRAPWELFFPESKDLSW